MEVDLHYPGWAIRRNSSAETPLEWYYPEQLVSVSGQGAHDLKSAFGQAAQGRKSHFSITPLLIAILFIPESKG
jgi:hypothetical protein